MDNIRLEENDEDMLIVDKVSVLIDALEASEPVPSSYGGASEGYASALTADEKRRVKKKLMELIDKF